MVVCSFYFVVYVLRFGTMQFYKSITTMVKDNALFLKQIYFYRTETLLFLSIIFIPIDGRVSFYAFLDDTIFQASKHRTGSDDNNIPNDAKVQSNHVLSAAIVGNSVNNLKNNVTIAFELKQVRSLKWKSIVTIKHWMQTGLVV